MVVERGEGGDQDAAWPAGWSRPWWGGWFMPSVFGLVAVPLLVAGLVLLTHADVEPEPVVLCLALGAGFGGVAVGTSPVRRGGPRPERREMVRGDTEPALAFDYSVPRLLGILVGLLGFTALGAFTALTADTTSTVVVGWLVVVLLGAVVVLAAVVGPNRRVLLTPERLVLVRGRRAISVRWTDVVDVVAVEQEVNGARNRFVGVVVTDRAVIGGLRRGMRWMTRADRRMLGVDLSIPVGGLVAPAELVVTARRLVREPTAREAVVSRARSRSSP